MRPTAPVLALAALLAASPALGHPDHVPPAQAAGAAPVKEATANDAIPRSQAPADARLYFIAPANRARVRSPVLVQFGLRSMGVTQAGSAAQRAGHHHVFVDAEEPRAGGDAPIPADRNHLHFGGGQTEAMIDLPPGRHTLQLVLGDATHRPFEPVVASRRITVDVLPSRRRR